jgi:hypothetical protein
MSDIRWQDLPSTDPTQVLPGKQALVPHGMHYDDVVPDTLDLAEVAKAYIQGITRTLMKNYFLMPPGHVYFYGEPKLDHNGGPENWGKSMQALLMARQMCGYDLDDLYGTLDIQYNSFRNMIDFRVNYNLTESHHGAWIVRPHPENIFPMSVALEALLELYKQAPQPRLEVLIRRMVAYHTDFYTNVKPCPYGEGPSAAPIGTKPGVFLTAPEIGEEMMYYGPCQWHAVEENFKDKPAGADGHMEYPFVCGKAMRALMIWHSISGDPDALLATTRLSNFQRNFQKSLFWQTRDPVPRGLGHFAGHIHGFLNGIIGMLWEADIALSKDPRDQRAYRLIDIADHAYRFVRDLHFETAVGNFGEICGVADMIRIALKLTDLGYPRTAFGLDYYDDVDRWLRNQIAESQIKPSHGLPSEPHSDDEHDRIGERVVGLFFENATHPIAIPNGIPDGSDASHLVACGLGNVMKCIYRAWNHIVQIKDSTARVNLLLNRASYYLDIKSELPYIGKVHVVTKATSGILDTVEVRIPLDIDRAKVRVLNNGVDTSQWEWVEWFASPYIRIKDLQPNTTYTVWFPVMRGGKLVSQYKGQKEMWTESTLVKPGSNTIYKCFFRHNTLVEVDHRPEGGIQLYQRQALANLGEAEIPAPTRSVRRFVMSPIRRIKTPYYFLKDPVNGTLQKVWLGGWPLEVTDVYTTYGIGTEWKLNTAFDFDNNGMPDIFGHNQTTGEVCIWYADADGYYGGKSPLTSISPEWELQVARFSRDGNVHIFGHNRGAGAEVRRVQVWHTNGSGIVSVSNLDEIETQWFLQLGDFNGDGLLDILGVDKDNNLYVWFLGIKADGSLFRVKDMPFGHIDPGWLLQVADIDNDGRADLIGYTPNNPSRVFIRVWNNQVDAYGRRYLDGGHNFGDLDLEWQNLQVADLDGDGYPDVLAQSTSSGIIHGWYSNGSVISTDTALGKAPGWIHMAGGNHLR